MTCDNFIIIKTFKFYSKSELASLYNKLKRLRDIETEYSFGRVSIPKFKIEVRGNTLKYSSEYIKGWIAGPKEMEIVYEDVVKRKGDWSLNNYEPKNYIVDEYKIKNGIKRYLYYIDLEDYGKIKISERIKKFNFEYKRYIKNTEQLLKGLKNSCMNIDVN